VAKAQQKGYKGINDDDDDDDDDDNVQDNSSRYSTGKLPV
jgi:hypothetical protein